MFAQNMLIVADIFVLAAYGFAKYKLKPKILRVSSLVMLVLYLAAVLYITIISRQSLTEPRWNIVPFPKDEFTNVFYHEFILNVLIFIPIGFFLSGILPQCKMIYTILIGIGISVFFELVQFFVHVGVCDINDLIASSIGCILSVLLAQIFRRLPKNQN